MARSLVVAALVRNEMDRFWPRALDAWGDFASEIVVLDDGSTDGTLEHAKAEYGVHVRKRGDILPAWGAEAHARRELFELAWGVARIDDFVFVLDADMVPARDPTIFARADTDALAFVLYDLWTPDSYRSDEFWRGHVTPRIWALRKTCEEPPSEWTYARKIHTGHFPSHDILNVTYVPPDYGLLHYAYVSPELREEKYVRYASVASELTEHEIAHARSILDPEPKLVSLPFDFDYPLV